MYKYFRLKSKWSGAPTRIRTADLLITNQDSILNQKGNVVGIAVATWVEKGVQGVHFGIKSSTLKTFASANGLSFSSPNTRDYSNKDLGKLITKGTVYIECHMTVAKIKKMIAQAENRKAFFKEHK